MHSLMHFTDIIMDTAVSLSMVPFFFNSLQRDLSSADVLLSTFGTRLNESISGQHLLRSATHLQLVELVLYQ